MNRKIILINPAYSYSSEMIKKSAWTAMPLGLLYLASVLEKNGHYVKIVDMEGNRLNNSDIRTIIENEKPSIIGFTATTPVIKNSLELCRMIKELNKDIKILLGGVHPTHLPMETINNDSVDIVVSGEGELTICELIDLLSNKPNELDQVKGIYFKKNGKVIFTGERELISNLDILPFPAWHLIDLGAYHHPLSRSERVAPVLTSRGCPLSCIFCSRGVFSHKYRKRSAKNIIEEIQVLIKEYNVSEIHFVDDAFTLSRSHVEELCYEIIKRNLHIKWATPNGIHVNTLDSNLLRLMKKAGCYSLSFGVESGNQETLDYVKKGQNLEKIKEIFNLCHKIGIETVALIIIGFPNEGRKETNKTISFLKEIKADHAAIHMLIPLPGTELYNELDKKCYILERDWSKYAFHKLPVYRTDYFSPEEIVNEYKRVYFAFHMRLNYIFSRLKHIRSWKQVKNNINGLLTLMTMKN